MQEIWKDIEGYEGLYQISNFGRVKSFCKSIAGKIIIQHLSCKGYYSVHLYKNGHMKNFTVHRLVAIHYIENKNHFPFINHKDENKLNNCVSNLEWCSPSYNTKYSFNLHPEWPGNLSKSKKGKIRGAYKKTRKPILQYSDGGKLIRAWDSCAQINRELHFHGWTVSECCRGNRRTAYGYKWRYATENISSRETA